MARITWTIIVLLLLILTGFLLLSLIFDWDNFSEPDNKSMEAGLKIIGGYLEQINSKSLNADGFSQTPIFYDDGCFCIFN